MHGCGERPQRTGIRSSSQADAALQIEPLIAVLKPSGRRRDGDGPDAGLDLIDDILANGDLADYTTQGTRPAPIPAAGWEERPMPATLTNWHWLWQNRNWNAVSFTNALRN